MLHLKLIYLIGIGVFLFSCGKNRVKEGEGSTVYFCGAENKVEIEGGRFVFRADNADFTVGEIQTNEFAFEGDYSVEMDSIHPYGMSLILTGIKKGEFFKASVWQKETIHQGSLICSVTGGTKFHLSSNENGINAFKNGWMKHVLQFEAVTDLDSVTFFLFTGGNIGEESVYFDNLEIKRYEKRPFETLDTDNSLSLYLPDSSRIKLDEYAEKAIKEEIIRNKYKKYVSAFLVEANGDSVSVEVRLKGDWTDHLITGNPSYRIKTASGSAFNGLRSFSIQHPKTRNYLDEWFIHKLCDSRGLLSTYYSFLPVQINDDFKGVYAIEEHFDKQLLESRNRREGPILKIDESGFWALGVMARDLGLDKISVPYYEAAIVKSFKQNRTLKSNTLFSQFINGSILLNHFKSGKFNPELIFDIDKIANYYALMDLGNIHHSLAWHNQRFYYNPITAKLEHIGFDMIPMIKPFNQLIAVEVFLIDKDNIDLSGLLDQKDLFLNEKFRKAYITALTQISSESYLDSVFEMYDTDLNKYEDLLASEMEDYTFKRSLYYEKATLIRGELKFLNKKWDAFMARNKTEPRINSDLKGKYDLKGMPFYLEEISVNAYRSKIDSAVYLMQFENFHYDSVTVIGYSIKANKDSLIKFLEPVSLKGFIGGEKVDTASFVLNEKPTRFFFTLKNLPGQIKKKKYIKWKKIKGEHPRIVLQQSFKNKSPFYTVKGNTVRFNSGAYQINQLVYIPNTFNVVFDAGTQIDFINGGGLILNGNTKMLGEEKAKINFTSSDSTGMGITILNADSVFVRCVEIENMNTLNYLGWTLTGAFTIYESVVDVDDLVIRGNNCEDGLNLIRSHFTIKNCLIEETKSDGFDADFCTGSFSESIFKNTGNDCIDFSGSVVDIANITIFNSGDKGISAGERSTLTVENIQINGAITGLAAKDDSFIKAKNITINNAEVGVAVFQKKPEYAGSYIELQNVTYSKLSKNAIVELGSKVTFKGKTYSGYEKFDIDQMYARFE